MGGCNENKADLMLVQDRSHFPTTTYLRSSIRILPERLHFSYPGLHFPIVIHSLAFAAISSIFSMPYRQRQQPVPHQQSKLSAKFDIACEKIRRIKVDFPTLLRKRQQGPTYAKQNTGPPQLNLNLSHESLGSLSPAMDGSADRKVRLLSQVNFPLP